MPEEKNKVEEEPTRRNPVQEESREIPPSQEEMMQRAIRGEMVLHRRRPEMEQRLEQGRAEVEARIAEERPVQIRIPSLSPIPIPRFIQEEIERARIIRDEGARPYSLREITSPEELRETREIGREYMALQEALSRGIAEKAIIEDHFKFLSSHFRIDRYITPNGLLPTYSIIFTLPSPPTSHIFSIEEGESLTSYIQEGIQHLLFLWLLQCKQAQIQDKATKRALLIEQEDG